MRKFYYLWNIFPAKKMIDAEIASPIQETSELTFMKSKYPNLK